MADPSWGPVAKHPVDAPKRGSVRWFRRVVGAFAILVALCVVAGAGPGVTTPSPRRRMRRSSRVTQCPTRSARSVQEARA